MRNFETHLLCENVVWKSYTMWNKCFELWDIQDQQLSSQGPLLLMPYSSLEHWGQV